MSRLAWAFVLISSLLYSCEPASSELNQNDNDLQLKYAQKFSVSKLADSLVIQVSRAYEGGKQGYRLALTKTPERIVVFSTVHVAFMENLGLADKIVGITNASYVYSHNFQERIEKGLCEDVGSEESPDFEKIISLQPDLVLIFGVNDQMNVFYDKLTDLGLKALPMSEYLEESPLAQAEWIKLYGVIFNQNDTADSLFDFVEANYQLQKKHAQTNSSVQVLFNIPWKGVWFMPGSNSFTARFLDDAGVKLLFEKTKVSSQTIEIEQVIEAANQADYWLNPGDIHSYEDLGSVLSSSNLIKAVKKRKVFNNNARVNLSGGNDYWEQGVVRPDLILRDLNIIFNNQTADSSMYFYKALD